MKQIDPTDNNAGPQTPGTESANHHLPAKHGAELTDEQKLLGGVLTRISRATALNEDHDMTLVVFLNADESAAVASMIRENGIPPCITTSLLQVPRHIGSLS